ncbi:autotransporter-associated beta strand repeat-containing protein [Marinomonas polaris DSM 16579]|uniref:Autotransporter-associated beta strand repeat-containing protein n=1 Tax=Marinomonas polaris DSM 16579 TaxID=1122206 RepID=A0A1M4TPP0_9GAMM|nr:cadherin domain-containing protein [Marinomonas polaris]SHE46364.1 autotransporter-associated beta strand repeat-containing protein [Marinomonas polaris DSM 16579]
MKKQYSNKSGKKASGHYSLGNKKQARKPLITALEPRLLLDGAAVATAIDVLTDSQLHDASQTDNSHQGSDTSFVVAPTEVRAVDPSLNNGKKEVVFIESNVADYQSLIDGVNAGVEVVLLDSTQDGLAQMAEWAKTHRDYDAIHVISHGAEGQVNLGGFSLDNITVKTRSADLAQLGAALNEDGDLLLYGCEVASGEGQDFIEALAQTTKADVTASDDLTGAAGKGGDWVLEKSIGQIDVAALQDVNYQGTLANVTFGFESGVSGVGSKTVTQTKDGETLTVVATENFGDSTQTTTYVDGSNSISTYTGSQFTSQLEFTISGKVFDFTSIKIYNANADATFTFTPNDGAAFTTSTISSDQTVTIDLSSAGFQGVSNITMTSSDSLGVVVDFDSVVLTNITAASDTTAPTVTSIVRQTPSGSTTNADSVVYRVTFDEAVSGIDTTDFNVSGTTATVTNVSSAGGNTYDVTVSGGDLVALNSTVTLSFASGQNITDTAGNALTATTPTGTNNSIYDVVNTPTVTTGDNTGDNLTFSNYTEDLADGGGLSLVEALHYASANQTVAFDLASGSTVNMNGGTLTVASGVTFDTDAMSALTISNGTLSLGGNVTFTNGTSDVLTVSSKLAGSNMLIKSGAGTLNLTSNANGSSSFATTVSAGTLAIGSVRNIGSGAISLSDATTFKVTEITSLANSVTLTGNSTIQTDGRLTLNNTVSGSGYTLTKAGSQSLTLAGTNSGSSLATTITAGNLIISSDANLGSGELTLNGGTLYLQSASDIITHDITLGSSGGTIQVTGSADATVSGNITGSGALTKGGGRVLTLSGSNSFSGGFYIAGSADGANVIVADGTNLGTGAVMLTKGLQLTGSGTITNDFVLNGGLISNANSVILSGILSGSGAMEKVDTGSLTLSGTNTYTGTTTVSAGTLTGTTSSLTGNIVNNAAVEFNQSTAGEYSKVISGTGTVTKSGSGILTLSGVNTYTGSTTVSFGGLTLVGGSNIADTSAVTLASAATLTLSGGNETIGSLAGAGNVVLGYRLTMGGNNTDTTFSGVISSTNTSGITKTGSGIFTLSGTNTYTGATTVSTGTLVASGGSAIADTSALTVSSGATFELDASVSETVGSIAGAGSIVASGGTLTVGGDNSSTTFSGVMSERSDALSLVKIGSGTLTLSGNNTYTGATTLSGGTLSVTGTMNGSGAGVVTVNAGTLEGSGTINSAVTVNAGATLSAGVAANTGTLTINGNLFLDEDSTLSATLSGASNYDKIVVNGSVELNNAQLTLSGDYVVPAAAEAQSFELLSNDGSDAITGNFSSLTEGAAKTFNDVDLATSYVGSTGNDFLLTGPTIASVTGVSATTDDGYYKVGDTIEITVTFSKAVTVDTTNGTPQLTLETGTTDRAATYVSGSGTNTLTFNYTVQDGDTSADLDYLSTAALVLSDGSIKDGTNDAILTLPTLSASGSLAANKAIVIDTTAPDAPTVDLSSDSDTGSSSTDNITNDNTPTITGTAEANATVTLYDTDDTTSLGTTIADGSGNWTITSSALSVGTHTLTTKVTDAAGNVSLASSGLTITIDTAGPILSSSSPVDDAVQVTQSGDIILTFDEDITKGYDTITLVNVTTGVTVETFDVLNGGNLTYSGNTLTLNPTNDLEEATTYAIRVDGNAVRDTAGNTYAGISDNATLNFTTGVMDSAAPSFLSIQRTSDAVVTGSTTSFTLTFNEAVDVTAADFVLATTGSVAGAIGFISGSGTNSITVNVTGVSGVGSLGLNLASGHAVKDLAGNNLATSEPADDEAYTVDTVAPTLISINRVDSATTNADSVQFIAVFSETVTGLGIDDFELTGTATNGANISSVTGTGNGFVVTISGVDGDGTLGVQLKSAATVNDIAGNALTATTPSALLETYTIENTAPTATAIITTNTALSTADSVTFDVTFSEAVTNVSMDDFEISGDVTGAISAVSGSGSSYTVTVSNIVGDGALGLNFNSGQNITDIAGNALAGTEPATDESYTIDNTLPTVTSISRGMVNQVEANTATDVVFTVVMSETVTGIETSDFSVTGSATNTGVSNVSSADGKVFKVTVSGVNGTIGQTVGLSFTGSASDALNQASNVQFTSGDSYTIAGTLLNEGALSQAQLDAIVDLNREGTLLEQSLADAKQVIIIDSRVPGLVEVTKQANPEADIWLLDGSRSATEQITEILSNYSDLDALHILSHGGVGEIYLGAETVSADAITQNSATYAAWGNALSDSGDILLYGCNVAQGDTGMAFINQFAQVTGADIAASDDLTGSAVLGGDWELERSAGSVETTMLSSESYSSVLADETISNSPGISSANTYGTTGVWGQSFTATKTGVLSSINLLVNTAAESDVTLSVYSGEGVGGALLHSQTVSASELSHLATDFTDWETISLSELVNITAGNRYTFVFGNADPVQFYYHTNTYAGGGLFASDSGGIQTDYDLLFEVVQGDAAVTNSAPNVSGAAASQAVNDTATLSPFSNVTLTDADNDNVSITVALDSAVKGTFTSASLTSSGFTDAGSGSYTLTSTTLASAQAALRALVFDPAENRVAVGLTESTTFTITVNDGTTNGTDNTTTVVSTSINDAPTDIALSDTTYGHSEGATNVVVGSFSATDADTGESFTYALVSGSGDTDNAKFTIDGNDLRATNRADVPAGIYNIRVQVNDGDATFEKSFSITVSDDIAPTISEVVPVDNATGVSVADSIQVTFDEGVQLGSSGTITLYDITGNGANSLTIDVNNHNGQLSIVGNKLTINPTNNLMATNQYAIQITAGVLTDSSNNALAAVSDTTSYNFTTGTVDTTAPTVAIVDVTSPTQPNASTVAINFSEQVVNIDISDFSLMKDGTAVDISGLVVAGSGSAYSIDLSSVTAVAGIYVLTLNTSDITDTSGNALAAGDSETFIIDTTAPAGVAIVRTGAENQNGSAATFTAVFSEAVSGVDAADFVLTGTAADGSITSVTQVSDSVYTVTVSGVSSDGTLGVNLKDSGTGITDTAGNAISAGVTGQQVTIDNTGPSVVAINRDGAVLTTADSATYTVTFNEAVTGVDVSDFSLSGGATGTVASITGSGRTYQVTVNNISGDGSLRLDLNASGTGITDTVSNAIGAGFTSGDTLTIDNTAPVVTASQAFNLDEGMVADTVIGQVKATDTNGVSQFSIQSGNDNGYFAIDNNGVVTLTSVGAAAIDYETETSYTLNIVATDAVGQASSAAAVTISINDINDNAPVFSSAETATLAENTAATTVVYDANATDADGTSAHNSVTYILKATGDHSAFTIDSTTGEVKLKAAADYETKSSYNFTVIASDGMRSTEQDVTLSITDVNDNTPSFVSGATGAVNENAAIGTVIYTSVASDADGTATNNTLRYSLTGTDSDKLNIDAVSGEVTLKASADYETQTSYSFNVIATDNGAGNFNSGSLSTTQAVTVSVNDLNDNTPVITSGATGSVDENADTSTVIYTATGTDADGTATNNTLRYSLSGDDADKLIIDATTGVVTLKASADYETQTSYSFNVMATDNGAGNFNSGSLSTTQAVIVSVNDLNDNTPVITSGVTGNVDENAATNTVIYTVAGTDGDGTAANNTLRYSLTGTDSDKLNIDAVSGEVTLKASADYETQTSYSFNVVATDNGAGNFNSGSLSTTQAVIVSVNDLNDNTPVMTSGATGSVNENADTSTVIYTATATDADGSATNNTLRYSLSGDDADKLIIDATTGEVTLKASADYETQTSYSFNVVATDNGAGNFNSGSLSTTQAVTVSVNDLNDNTPVMTSGAAGSVNENADTSTVIYTATGTDADGSATNNTLRYSLSGDDADKLIIDATTGEVTLKASADYETQTSYSFNVMATDNGAGNFNSGSLSTTQAVTVSVNDLNDNTPVMTSGATGSVDENADTSTVIYTATGTDADGTATNNTLRYSLSGDDADKLIIDATTGEVTLKASADYETKTSYSFNVVATDNGAGNFNSGSLSTTQAVTVSVNDLNDNTPVMTSGATGSVDENADTSTVIYTATGTDADGTATNNTLRYSLSGDDADKLIIDATTGVVTLKASADYETKSSYSFNVVATDNGAGNFNSGSLSTTQAVIVSVNDLNDNTPTVSAGAETAILVEAGGVNNAAAGTNSSSITLTKGDVDTVGSVSYDSTYLTNNGWTTLDNGATYLRIGTYGTATLTVSTDVVSYVLNNNDSDTQTLVVGQSVTDSFTIQVTDGNATKSTSAVFNITGANDAPIASGIVVAMTGTSSQVFNPVTLPSDLFTDLDNGETSKLVWSVENLPTGMVFNALTHTISGTPTGGFEGVNTLQVVATDPNGAQVKVPVTLTLRPSPVTPPVEANAIAPPSPQQEVDNTEFSAPEISQGVDVLPSGIIETSAGATGFAGEAAEGVDNAQLVESVVPVDSNAANTSNGAIVSESRVSVDVGANGQVRVSEIAGQSSNVTGLTVASLITQTDRVSISLADTGAAASYSATLSDGSSLPSWVEVNPSTGEVTMIPPAGQGKITLKINATDAEGNIRVLEIEVDLENLPAPVQNELTESAAQANGAIFVPLDEQLAIAAEQFDEYGNDLIKLLAS